MKQITGVLRKASEGSVDGGDLVGSCIAIAQVAEEAMGGTSGALYSCVFTFRQNERHRRIRSRSSIFFSALAQGLQTQDATAGTTIITTEAWSTALTFTLHKLYSYTRARPPSRTLVDPLAAFVETLAGSEGKDLKAAVQAAAAAAERTKDVEAKAGRSAYVEGERLREKRVPDPGAWGVKTILESWVG